MKQMANKKKTTTKKDVKKERDNAFLIFFIIVLVILVIILSFLSKKAEKIVVTSEDVCVENVIYLGKVGERRVFSKCLDSIQINGDNLKDMLTIANQDTESNEYKTLKKIYDTNYYATKYTANRYNTFINEKQDYLVIECNLEDVSDIFITPANDEKRATEFDANIIYCTKHPFTFIKTYRVESIRKINDEKYFISLSNEAGSIDALSYSNDVEEEIKDILDSVEAGKTYNFKLHLKDDSENVSNTIKSIMENSDIISVEETKDITYDEEVKY